FFQAEDGIRDFHVTGVQTCALPISEVYLGAAQAVLEQGQQVLLMVPEINLTPQLELSLRTRLSAIGGPDCLAVLHSGLADGERRSEERRVGKECRSRWPGYESEERR